MKLIVNADGVRKLIEHDPEGSVEVAKNAAAQVATQIARRMVPPIVETTIKEHIDRYVVVRRATTNKNIISLEAEKIIREAAHNFLEAEKSMTETAERVEAITRLVQGILQKQEEEMVKRLEARLDEIIIQRFAKLLTSATTTPAT
jgi:hypothetical protein